MSSQNVFCFFLLLILTCNIMCKILAVVNLALTFSSKPSYSINKTKKHAKPSYGSNNEIYHTRPLLFFNTAGFHDFQSLSHNECVCVLCVHRFLASKGNINTCCHLWNLRHFSVWLFFECLHCIFTSMVFS